jgi:hypothetical protein
VVEAGCPRVNDHRGHGALVAGREGLGLLPVFFGDIAALGWPGQFNLDVLFYLGLSAFWLAWRHHFSALGWVLGLLGRVRATGQPGPA